MSEPLSLDDLVAPVTDLGRDFPEAMASWRWLVSEKSKPLLITAMGDVFLDLSTSVWFLDTERGTVDRVAASREAWKESMKDPERLAAWFRPALVHQLVQHGLALKSGEVFSPLVPAVLGGTENPKNFTTSQWRNHLHILGQVHDQVRRLPPGTRMDRIVFDEIPARPDVKKD